MMSSVTGVNDKTLTLPQSARALGISIEAALGLIKDGRLPAVRTADGDVLVRRADLDAYGRAAPVT